MRRGYRGYTPPATAFFHKQFLHAVQRPHLLRAALNLGVHGA